MVKLDEERIQPMVFDLAEALALARDDKSAEADDLRWLQRFTDRIVLAGMRMYAINVALGNKAHDLEERAGIHDRIAERQAAQQKQMDAPTQADAPVHKQPEGTADAKP
jgi:hypothetical protein